MAVKLRLMRVGKKNHPCYRVCAIDSRKPRHGRYLESIGFYDPHVADEQKKVRLDRERAEYWLSVGAQPTETVLSFLRKAQVAGLARLQSSRAKRRRPRKRASQRAARRGEKGKTETT